MGNTRKNLSPDFCWYAVRWDCNKREFVVFNTLTRLEDFIKKLKKKLNYDFSRRAEFSEAIRRELRWRYWSKCEYEIVLNKTDGGVLLTQWPPVERDTPAAPPVFTNASLTFNWENFYLHFATDREKIKADVFNQLEYHWDDLMDYLWNFRHKYQRHNK